MAKYSYLWRTTDKKAPMWLPMKKGKEFEKRGMVEFVGRFKLAGGNSGTSLVEAPIKGKKVSAKTVRKGR